MSIEAMKQALEALELAKRSYGVVLLSDPPQDAWKTRGVNGEIDKSITFLRQAIAEAEKQEPVAYISNKRQRLNIELKPQTFVDVPTVTDWEMPLYMKPPQRTWVGLMDKEIEEFMDNYDVASPDYAKVIEAKLKEKNT